MIDAMTATSRWATGTYELVLDYTKDDGADMVATIFAKPLEVGTDADEDAPILSQMGLLFAELGERRGIFAEEKPAVVDIGEHGLEPENLERDFTTVADIMGGVDGRHSAGAELPSSMR